jgi:hypothetical protein
MSQIGDIFDRVRKAVSWTLQLLDFSMVTDIIEPNKATMGGSIVTWAQQLKEGRT